MSPAERLAQWEAAQCFLDAAVSMSVLCRAYSARRSSLPVLSQYTGDGLNARGTRWGLTMAQRTLLCSMLAAVLLVGCSGDLSGNFYYTTRGGDVKRLADREVLLIAATPEFEAQWQKAVADFKPAEAVAKTAYEEAPHGTEVGMQRAIELEEVQKTWTQHALKLVAWGTVKRARTDINGRFIFQGVAKGRYYLFAEAEVPILIGRLEMMSQRWWVPIEIRPGTQTVDLTSNNVGNWPFSHMYR